jgi:hypothetical protein
MRYILSLALLLSACTRANSDYLGSGGHAGSGGGGSAGSGGGGSAGSGGGGGGSASVDLAMSVPHDMAQPRDMASFVGTECGTMSCTGNEPDCCVNNSGDHCVSDNAGCTNGPLFSCDGKEDCTGQFSGDYCCLQLSGGSTKVAGSGCMLSDDPDCNDILCHTVDADCPPQSGYVDCCPIANSQYKRCSKAACP